MKTIYYHGQVYTGDMPLCEAFSVEEGRFVSAGSDREVLATRAEGDEAVDLGGFARVSDEIRAILLAKKAEKGIDKVGENVVI